MSEYFLTVNMCNEAFSPFPFILGVFSAGSVLEMQQLIKMKRPMLK